MSETSTEDVLVEPGAEEYLSDLIAAGFRLQEHPYGTFAWLQAVTRYGAPDEELAAVSSKGFRTLAIDHGDYDSFTTPPIVYLWSPTLPEEYGDYLEIEGDDEEGSRFHRKLAQEWLAKVLPPDRQILATGFAMVGWATLEELDMLANDGLQV